MRRILLPVAVVLAWALAALPAHAAQSPTLAQAAGARFPDRTYVLTLPRAAAVSAVEVRENGRAMRAVDVQSADAAGAEGFGVVLAIDTSGSMHGRAMAGAITAARAFVAHRSPQQPVALVAFGAEVRVVLPFSTDAAAIDRALGSIADGSFRSIAPSGAPAPGRAGGSRMLDAAARGVQLVHAGHQAAGSIVLLTDGADQGSTATLDGLAKLATGAGIRIYTVGLRTSTSDFGTLNRLAAATHAEFSPAGSLDDLARIYGRLGSRLAHQYVIRYRSPAAPAERVEVAVRVAGFPGVAATSYVSPAAPSHHAAPFHHSPAETLWLRPGAAVGVSVLAVALLGIALWVALRPRGRSLRARMAAYVGLPEPEADRIRALTAAAIRSGKGASQRMDGAAWMADLREQLDVGRVDVPAERLVGWVAATMLAMLVLLPLTSGVPAAALLAFGVPIGARAYVKRSVRKQRRLFTEQLPDNLQVMASAMRAGHSFAGSLAVVSEEAPEPARSEFKRVLADERLGVPVDQALRIAVGRMDSTELEQVALVAALQRETGGNTAEVLERVTDTVRERVAVRRLVKTLTAQGRLSRWVLSAIPVVLLAFITASNPDYVRPLYTTPIGHALLIVAAVMVTSGSLIIKRIIDIKV